MMRRCLLLSGVVVVLTSCGTSMIDRKSDAAVTSVTSDAPAVAAISGVSLSPTHPLHGSILRAGLRSDKQCPSYCYNQHTHILHHGSEEHRIALIQECVALCKGLRQDYAGSPSFPAWRVNRSRQSRS